MKNALGISADNANPTQRKGMMAVTNRGSRPRAMNSSPAHWKGVVSKMAMIMNHVYDLNCKSCRP